MSERIAYGEVECKAFFPDFVTQKVTIFYCVD